MNSFKLYIFTWNLFLNHGRKKSDLKFPGAPGQFEVELETSWMNHDSGCNEFLSVSSSDENLFNAVINWGLPWLLCNICLSFYGDLIFDVMFLQILGLTRYGLTFGIVNWNIFVSNPQLRWSTNAINMNQIKENSILARYQTKTFRFNQKAQFLIKTWNISKKLSYHKENVSNDVHF